VLKALLVLFVISLSGAFQSARGSAPADYDGDGKADVGVFRAGS